MNILFYNTYTINDMYFGLLLDEAIRYLREGHRVTLLSCHGVVGSCLRNPLANEGICSVCRYNFNFVCKKLPENLFIYRLTDLYSGEANFNECFIYNNIFDIKKLSYKGINIGYGAFSTYVSLTRNANPLLDENFRKYFDSILQATCLLLASMETAIERINPDVVCFFNGRFYETRVVYEVARAKGCMTWAYESVGGFGGESVFKVVFENSLPHGIHKNQELAQSTWDNSSLTLEERKQKGRSFFEKRRSGIPAGDVVFTTGQSRGKLPDNWNESLKNIVIFNSSEDEFVSIGDEFDRLNFFESQLVGIKTILKLFVSDMSIHFYLRIHPNLSKIRYKYHTDLYKLEDEYPNVTVIAANDKVDTYNLMENAEKIIVFGSTMGLESVYWGKGVILLGPAVYYYSDLCYIPHDITELKDLISQKLIPKNQIEAIKWGFYFMARETNIIHKTENSDFDYTPIEFSFFTKKLYACTYNRILGSYKLMCIWLGMLKFIKMMLYQNKYILPLKER